MKASLVKALAVTYYLVTGKSPDNFLKSALTEELEKYPEDDVLHALNRCKLECKGFLPLAEIIERMPSKRLTANEAWAIVPKSEYESVVWDDVTQEAYGAAHGFLMSCDMQAARMAFIEAYRRIEGDKRHFTPKYTLSAGTDINNRVDVLKNAVQKGLITKQYALKRLPVHECSDLQLSFFEDNTPILTDGKEQIGRIIKMLTEKETKTE
jgi:hypothetical protein